jgi:hypothetical protein
MEAFLNKRTIILKQEKVTLHINAKEVLAEVKKNNSKCIFTWYVFYYLKTPNTTNAIDGHF